MEIGEIAKIESSPTNLDAYYNELLMRDKPKTAGDMLSDTLYDSFFKQPEKGNTTINVTGNTLLDKDAGVVLGDQIMKQLKLSNAL